MLRVERSRVDWLSVEDAMSIIASAPTMLFRVMENAEGPQCDNDMLSRGAAR